MPERPTPYRGGTPLSELARTTTNAKSLREQANEDGLTAIRSLERSLKDALDGERLYETPNLAVANLPLYGYRVRTKRPDEPLRYGGRPSLIVGDSGDLLMAWRTRDGGNGWQAATDEELRGEDLARILEVVALAIERHIEKAGRRSRRFQHIVELADKVTFILGEE